jgi:hypothetical protein
MLFDKGTPRTAGQSAEKKTCMVESRSNIAMEAVRFFVRRERWDQ